MDEKQRASPEVRYPLAFDANGNPIELPPEAVKWRVRRGGGRRGRPRHVFDAETGRQLELPLTATIDTLIDAGCTADRYLLYPVDGEGHLIGGIIAVTEIAEGVDGEPDPMAPMPEQTALLTVITHQLAALKEQSQTLCRALEATTSGYGRVRPLEPPVAPIVVEQPPPLPDKEAGGLLGGLKAEEIGQLLGYFKMAYDMVRGGGGAPPAASVPVSP